MMGHDKHDLAVLGSLAAHHEELANSYLDHVATLTTSGCSNLAAKYSLLAEDEFHEQALIVNRLFDLDMS